MNGHKIIPVWFFVGVLLAIFGVLILASGIAEWSNAGAVALGKLHAPVWWGGLLIVTGVIYCLAFRPGRGSR